MWKKRVGWEALFSCLSILVVPPFEVIKRNYWRQIGGSLLVYWGFALANKVVSEIVVNNLNLPESLD